MGTELMVEEEDYFRGKEITGCIDIERVAGKSVATRLFSKYPLKLISPSKVAPSVDVVWIYTISYGGGFVSGDCVFLKLKVANCCTAVMTTQASTKIYQSINGQVCEQLLQVCVERNGIFVLLPEPVTCFCKAKYNQFQTFSVAIDASVLLVDWCTSGRRERGEVWSFDQYKSTNRIFLEGKGPLFLDSMCLENEAGHSILNRMQPFQVVAMVLVWGPQLQSICRQLEEVVQLINRTIFGMKSPHFKDRMSLPDGVKYSNFVHPSFLVSCSNFGPKDDGLVVRIVANTTELVYDFFRYHLSGLSSIIGVLPYTRKS